MKKSICLSLSLIVILTLALGGSVYGFSDVNDDPGKEQILFLKQQNLINGVGNDRFAPQQHLTLAHGITMIVNALQLNLDHITFIKAPQASDYFDQVSDDAWYANAFITAHHNHIGLPKDLDPRAVLSKEEFTHYLFQAMMQTGDYAFIELFILIEDSEEIEAEYMNSIQKMIIADIASLGEDKKFYPKEKITRSEAAVMLYKTMEYIKNNSHNETGEIDMPEWKTNEEVAVIVEPLNEEVEKVTLDWGQQPNPGYGISVNRIEFDHGKKKARIVYQLHYPDPERFYPQVIVHAKTETYVAAGYEIEAVQAVGKGFDHVESSRPMIPAPVEPPKMIE